MALAHASDVSTQGKALPKEQMKLLLTKFAEEAFLFLKYNAHIWIEYPKNFMSRHVIPYNNSVFTATMAKAILTISYLLRTEYREQFRFGTCFMKDPYQYERYLMNYPIQKDMHYFYSFLSWVAFVFSFTTFCYKEGYDYINISERCIARYADLEYFNNNGGFCILKEYSEYMKVIYNDIIPIIRKQLAQDNVIVPFLNYVENIERRNRYSSNKWLHTSNMLGTEHVKSKLSTKYAFVLTLDLRRVVPGYKVVLKKSPTKSPVKASLRSSKTLVSETATLDNSKQCAGDSDIPVSKIEPSIPCGTDYSKTAFIIHKRFLSKMEASRNSNSKYKRGLKIYSPSNDREALAMNLNKILEENIEKRNYSKIGKSLYGICSPGCSIDDENTRVIVLDTSSEEEDCGAPKPLDEVLQAIWLNHRKRAEAKSESERSLSEPKFTSKKSKEQTSENWKTVKAKAGKSETKSSKTESKESGTSVLSGRTPNLPTKCTGAVSKDIASISKKSHINVQPTDNRDLKDSNYNNEQRQNTGRRKPPRGRKQSRK